MIIRAVKKLISTSVFGCPRLYFFALPGEQTSSRAASRRGVRPSAVFYFRQINRHTESLAQRLFPGSWEEVPALGKIRRSTGFIDRMRPNQVGERQGGKREGE